MCAVYRGLTGRDLDGVVHHIEANIALDSVYVTACNEYFLWVGERAFTDLLILYKSTEKATCIMCLTEASPDGT